MARFPRISKIRGSVTHNRLFINIELSLRLNQKVGSRRCRGLCYCERVPQQNIDHNRTPWNGALIFWASLPLGGHRSILPGYHLELNSYDSSLTLCLACHVIILSYRLRTYPFLGGGCGNLNQYWTIPTWSPTTFVCWSWKHKFVCVG